MSDKYSISKDLIDEILKVLDSFKWDFKYDLHKHDVITCINDLKSAISDQDIKIISNEEKTTTKVPKVRRVKYL